MRFQPFLLVLAFVPALASEAEAQKPRVGREWHEDGHNGYRFRFPDKWRVTPVQKSTKEFGVIARMGGPTLSTKMPGNKSGNVALFLQVFAFKQKAAVTRAEEEGTGGLRDLIDGEGGSRQKVSDFLPSMYRGLRDLRMTEEEEGKTTKKFPWHREIYDAFTGDYDIRYDTYTFRLDDRDIVLAFAVPKQHFKKWARTLEKCANTFQLIEFTKEVKVLDHTDYNSVLAAAKDETSLVSGWRVVEVPSKRYILKTSSTDKGFLKELVTRLEKSRDLFEKDFPPSKVIAHISIVRVCKDYQEFLTYGEVPSGVVGFFSPTSTELVVVDLKSINRDITWSTVTHEAFHQYCHFLFDESEAHRWYDEGHGDYYGFFEFKGKKAIPGYKRGGESRLSEVKPLVKAATFTPIAELLRMDHRSWQAIYSHYAQSWSVIYMLRRGMEGDVAKKYWDSDYEMIIPNYVRTLHQGFLDAYEVIRKERLEKAKREDREATEEELNINRFDLRQAQKEKIWDQALANSWGQIDIEKFQEDWVNYILKGVR